MQFIPLERLLLATFAPCSVLIMDVLTIQSDEVALQAIKENTRPRYLKLWKDFKEFTGDESLDIRVPSEDEILNFVRHLRDDKGILIVFVIFVTFVTFVTL